ncbi:MAG: hypothetical protein MK135_09700 [Polyangiaceae bacterium]|nr:hypothetical protein [Polyangiaceae bacterium]
MVRIAHTPALWGILVAGACLLGSSSDAAAFEHQHALGPSYQYLHLRSASGSKFNLHQLGINYEGRYGGDLAGLFRATWLIPLSASQEGQTMIPLRDYSRARGVDLFLGLGTRFDIAESWKLDFGLGAHTQFIRLVSDQYVEWSTWSFGLGAVGQAYYSLPGSLWGARPEMGIRSELDFDFVDFARAGDLNLAVNAIFSTTIGLRWGGE